MKKTGCNTAAELMRGKDFFECGGCGNHVCKTQAELWGRVCPHCFGRLYRIS